MTATQRLLSAPVRAQSAPARRLPSMHPVREQVKRAHVAECIVYGGMYEREELIRYALDLVALNSAPATVLLESPLGIRTTVEIPVSATH